MSLDPFEIPSPSGSKEQSLNEEPIINGSKLPLALPVSSPVGSKGKLLDNDDNDDDDDDEPIFFDSDDDGAEDAKDKDEDDEDEDDDDDIEDARFRKRCSDQQRGKKERMNAIIAQFTPEQMERYESYRRSRLRRANMRKVLQNVAGCPVSLKMAILMSGIAKIYVGDLIEISRTVMAQRNVTGPIRPCDVREAYRRLELEGKIPKLSRNRLFKS